MTRRVYICGIDTSTLPKLTHDESNRLLSAIKSGDEQAKDYYIYCNMRLVLSVAQRFVSSKENMDDIFQVGCVGLMKAIDNFDLSYNVKLSTYACPMIEGEIKRMLRDDNSIRISRSVKDLAYKVLKLKEELSENGKEPSNKVVADILNVSEYDIANALDSLKEPVSMYEPIYNDGGDTIYLFDQIAGKEDEYDLESKLALDKAIKNLKEREINILKERFIIGKTQMEIAAELGISQAQISRIEKNAIKTLKKYVK